MGTTAKKKKTLENLKDMIYKVSIGEIKCNPKVIEYENKDRVVKEENKIEEEKVSKILNRAEEICKKVCTFESENYSSRDRKIDRILTSKKFGIPIMILFFSNNFLDNNCRCKLSFKNIIYVFWLDTRKISDICKFCALS